MPMKNEELELIKELKRLVQPNYTITSSSKQYNIAFKNGEVIVVNKITPSSKIRTNIVGSK